MVLDFLSQDQSFQVDYKNCRDVCVGECFRRPAGFLASLAPICVVALEHLWLKEVVYSFSSSEVLESVAICREISCVLSVVVVNLLQWEHWTFEDI